MSLNSLGAPTRAVNTFVAKRKVSGKNLRVKQTYRVSISTYDSDFIGCVDISVVAEVSLQDHFSVCTELRYRQCDEQVMWQKN